MNDSETILGEYQSANPVDGLSDGHILYEGIQDLVFDAPGRWQISENATRDLIWLSFRPTSAELWKAYANYYTHGVTSPGSVFKIFFGTGPVPTKIRSLLMGLGGNISKAATERLLGYPAGSGGALFRAAAAVATLFRPFRDGITTGSARIRYGQTGKLLDVGCGNGNFLRVARGRGWDVTGVEIDPDAVRYCREVQEIDVRHGDLIGQKFDTDRFDIVHVSHVIEHVYDPAGLLEECLRVLKPGGRIFITTPNARGFGHAYWGQDWRGLEPPRHLVIFSPSSMRRLLSHCGFEAINVVTSTRLARGIWYASRTTRRRRKGKSVATRHYIESLGAPALCATIQLFSSDSGDELVAEASKPNRVKDNEDAS